MFHDITDDRLTRYSFLTTQQLSSFYDGKVWIVVVYYCLIFHCLNNANVPTIWLIFLGFEYDLILF